MESQSYYRMKNVENNNIADDSAPILVNCAGYEYLDWSFRSENTRQDYYLQFLDAGKLTLFPTSRRESLSPGEFIIYRRGTAYQYEMPKGRVIGYYWAHFTGSYIEQLMANAGLSFDTVYDAGMENETPRRVFAQMFREFILRDTGFEVSCGALLAELLVELGRAAAAERGERTVPFISRFTRSLSYIHQNYPSAIRIADLAKMEGLSVSRYRDVFQRITGTSPIEYIIALRIQRACELLSTTNYTVGQIAGMCGYDDALYFNRLFKKKTGVSPGAYR